MREAKPWFPYYVLKWETDEAVRGMTFEEEGIFMALLRAQWVHGTVPADPAEVQRLLIKPASREAIERVLQSFVSAGSPASAGLEAGLKQKGSLASRCFNCHLERIRESVTSTSVKRSRAGHKGGVVSGVIRRSPALAPLEARLKPTPSKPYIYSPSISSSVSEEQEQQQKPEVVQEDVPGVALARVGGGGNGKGVMPAGPNTAKAVERATLKRAARQAVEVAFVYHRDNMGFNARTTRLVPDGDREKLLTRRLAESGDLSELLFASDGCRKNDFLMGRDPKSNGTHNTFETVYRNRGRVERLAREAGYTGQRHPYLDALETTAPENQPELL